MPIAKLLKLDRNNERMSRLARGSWRKFIWEVGFGVLGVEMTGLGTNSVPNTLPYPDILSGVPYPTLNF